MKKITLLLTMLFQVLFAVNLPQIKIDEMPSHGRYEWIEITGVISNFSEYAQCEISDSTDTATLIFEDVLSKKAREVLDNLKIGDTITVQGENKPKASNFTKFDKISAVRITKDEQTLYMKRYKYEIEPSKELESLSELDKILRNYHHSTNTYIKKRRMAAGTLVVWGSVCNSIALVSVLRSKGEGLGMMLIFPGLALSVPGFGVMNNLRDERRKQEAAPADPNLTQKSVTWGIELKPIPKGGGLFLTGNF